ncbi:hypothetical protein FS827_25295 [Agrobacterium vitis]|uniref:hypothetical protein n=1 Tax=Allorhizobium ampelinum TaxID=3025782 RepID=UPI001F24CF39|nr:hypothetical protein [Allorhizobium ampelinum]MCF1464602.1 hypothetical protein [Allorhizobium ampelinum]
MSPSYLLKSQLSEKQIEADVSFYLGWCSNDMPFRLLDIDEQETGADKLSTVTVPIYIQFKKSQGLQPLPPQQLKRRVVEDKMQSVRRFRRDNMLSDDPTLFFGLRAMAEHASDFQHNILLDHHRPESSHAIYVAPLHLDKERYFVDLLTGKRHLDDPWIWKRAELLSDVGLRAWLSRYAFQPFLRNHISIAPHERVSTHRHFYAFSASGDEVSWHSPSVVPGGPFRLSDFMTSRVRQMIAGTGDLPSPEQALGVCEYVAERYNFDIPGLRSSGTAFDRLRHYGRWLHKAHDIRQILLCADREKIMAIRERVFV